MKITYDPTADALHITFKEGVINKTLEIAPEVFIDFDKNKEPLYLEIIGASEKISKNKNSADILIQNFAYDKHVYAKTNLQ